MPPAYFVSLTSAMISTSQKMIECLPLSHSCASLSPPMEQGRSEKALSFCGFSGLNCGTQSMVPPGWESLDLRTQLKVPLLSPQQHLSALPTFLLRFSISKHSETIEITPTPLMPLYGWWLALPFGPNVD